MAEPILIISTSTIPWTLSWHPRLSWFPQEIWYNRCHSVPKAHPDKAQSHSHYPQHNHNQWYLPLIVYALEGEYLDHYLGWTYPYTSISPPLLTDSSILLLSSFIVPAPASDLTITRVHVSYVLPRPVSPYPPCPHLQMGPPSLISISQTIELLPMPQTDSSACLRPECPCSADLLELPQRRCLHCSSVLLGH